MLFYIIIRLTFDDKYQIVVCVFYKLFFNKQYLIFSHRWKLYAIKFQIKLFFTILHELGHYLQRFLED